MAIAGRLYGSVAWLSLGVLLFFTTPRVEAHVHHLSGLVQFYEFLQTHPFVATAFVADYCPHSKELKPEWARAAAVLRDEEVELAEVDLSDPKNGDLKHQFAITATPAIYLFRRGYPDRPQQLSGPRDAEALVEQLRREAAPALVALRSAKEVEAFFGGAAVAVLGWFDAPSGEGFEAFERLVSQNRASAAFAYVVDRGLMAGCGVPAATLGQAPVLTLRSKRDPDPAVYEGVLNDQALDAWFLVHSTPLVVFMTTDNMDEFRAAWEAKVHKVVLALDEASPELVKAAEDAAKHNQDLKFVVVPYAEGLDLLAFLGVEKSDLPALLAFEHDTNYRYLRPSIATDDVAEFVREFQEGALPRYYKSAKEPKHNKGPVKTLTARSFEKITKGRPTLLMVYAESCPRCHEVLPVFRAIGDTFDKDPELLMAIIEGHDNEVPLKNVTLSSFPAIYYIEHDGQVTQFTGDMKDRETLTFFLLEQLGRPTDSAMYGDPGEELIGLNHDDDSELSVRSLHEDVEPEEEAGEDESDDEEESAEEDSDDEDSDDESEDEVDSDEGDSDDSDDSDEDDSDEDSSDGDDSGDEAHDEL